MGLCECVVFLSFSIKFDCMVMVVVGFVVFFNEFDFLEVVGVND